jgi:hypothetical protein
MDEKDLYRAATQAVEENPCAQPLSHVLPRSMKSPRAAERRESFPATLSLMEQDFVLIQVRREVMNGA